mgnify:CR=1 FL=1
MLIDALLLVSPLLLLTVVLLLAELIYDLFH